MMRTTQKTLSTDERAAAFEEWLTSHRPTPQLADYSGTSANFELDVLGS